MLWLVVLFLFGIVLLVLLVVLRLGVYRLLVMVVALVAAHADSAGNSGGEVSGLGVFHDSRSRPLRKRFRLNRKNPAHLVEVVAHSRPRVWKRLRQVGFLDLSMPDHIGGVVIMLLGALFKSMTEWGLGDFPGLCAGPRLQVRTTFELACCCSRVA